MPVKIVKWSLRLGAWLCLLAAVGRLIAFPKQAWLTGRIFQTHVLFESSRAARAFFNELGLDQHLDPDEYQMRPVAGSDYSAPARLVLMIREREFYSGPDAYIWLEADGSYVLPPLAVSYRNPDRRMANTSFLRLQSRDATPLFAAIVRETNMNDDNWEGMIWIHRGDRWVNVLRVMGWQPLKSERFVQEGFSKYVSDWSSGDRPWFVWDPQTESFLVSDDAVDYFKLLEPRPDQTGIRPPPSIDLSSSAMEPFVKEGDLDGLRELFARASRGFGWDVSIPEWVLNDVGDTLLAKGRSADAIAAFKLNVELYPHSPNVHDSLAEAYEADGQLELAKSLYERACR